MGLPEWFSCMRKKGHDPKVLHRLLLATNVRGAQSADVLGSLYRVILDAYSNNRQDKVHSILEQELLKYGSPATSVLYVDGEYPREVVAAYLQHQRVIVKNTENKTFGMANRVFIDRKADASGCPAFGSKPSMEWIGTKLLGYLIKAFLCDVDPAGLSDLSSEKKGKLGLGHWAAVRLLSLDEIRTHVTLLQEPDAKDICSEARTNGRLSHYVAWLQVA